MEAAALGGDDSKLGELLEPDIKTFTYDNSGKILYSVSTGQKEPAGGKRIDYFYANNKPVGEAVTNGDAGSTYFTGRIGDTGSYGLSNTPALTERAYDPQTEAAINEALSGTAVSEHTVVAGDTLRSIAQTYYGSPDLWYVIAEANGLSGKEDLKVGSRLIVPLSSDGSYNTAETFALYNEGEIVGSKLPNVFVVPPAEPSDCQTAIAIILIVVVSIAAIVATGGAASFAVGAVAASAAAAGLATSVGVVGGLIAAAVVGGAIAFAASVVTQGILIGFQLQDDFDFEAVAIDSVAGAFTGLGAGLGAVGKAVQVAKLTSVTKNTVTAGRVVLTAALDAAAETASQALQNDGKVTNGELIALSAGLAVAGELAEVAADARSASKKARVQWQPAIIRISATLQGVDPCMDLVPTLENC